MIRTQNVAERNIMLDKSIASPQAIPAAAPTTVIPDQTSTVGEIAYRYVTNSPLQNNTLLYALGRDCTAVDYDGWLVPGQPLDASNHRLMVSVYCAGGTTVAVSVLKRSDLDKHVNIKNS